MAGRHINKPGGKGAAIAVASAPLLPAALLDDRDFLDALEMTDTETSLYLGKSRQTINTMLKSQKDPSGTRAKDYLRCADMTHLINAALIKGVKLDKPRLADYIRRERSKDKGKDIALSLLEPKSSAIAWDEVESLVLILPQFGLLEKHRSDALLEIRQLISEMAARGKKDNVALVAETPSWAETAAYGMGLTSAHCSSHATAEHYIPTVLLSGHTEDKHRLLVVTEANSLSPAPQFCVATVAACVQRLLSAESAAKKLLEAARARSALSNATANANTGAA
jgi:hypothetical protein